MRRSCTGRWRASTEGGAVTARMRLASCHRFVTPAQRRRGRGRGREAAALDQIGVAALGALDQVTPRRAGWCRSRRNTLLDEDPATTEKTTSVGIEKS